MRKLITSGLVALATAATLGASAAPAAADPWHGGGYHHDRDWHGGGYRGGPGWGLAGLAALGLTAAIVSENNRPYYRPGYYDGPGYGPGYGPATCVATRRVWNRYYGAYELRSVYVPC